MEDPKCPECQSPMDVIPEGTIVEIYLTGFNVRGRALPVRERKATIACCQGCEFSIEITG